MAPGVFAVCGLIAAGWFVGNEVRHDFTALRHHGRGHVLTLHPVTCERHGKVYLNEKDWAKYAGDKSPFSHPSCPICGRPAEEITGSEIQR